MHHAMIKKEGETEKRKERRCLGVYVTQFLNPLKAGEQCRLRPLVKNVGESSASCSLRELLLWGGQLASLHQCLTKLYLLLSELFLNPLKKISG